MIYLARLRLGRVILALTRLHTADQRVFSSGPTIQLGPVILAARLRLRRVMIELTLVRTMSSARFFRRPDAARVRDCSNLIPTRARNVSVGPDRLEFVH